ncbi:heat-inducible transcriptional repressor HrcA [Paenisporosarcina sp. TG20]|uniref:heat-inducible transcriptional repressor HrcA n=1 Tax=Paenisporosarcina sp. TG20 TaxID=1211706 RepID=UPI0002D70775|nr:heat-inducible transcriptional repressor HrcA [Paenisporosarcina sp. TG20]
MLTNRQLLILQVTVDEFIQFAQPVGSRQLSKKKEVPFSPATIRNEMADLEELGYLEKTHTSSGRIPSEKGYRFYVDHLLIPQLATTEDMKQIQSVFKERISETEKVIQKTAMILSELTSYTSILLGPDVRKHRVKRFSIVPLSSDSAVAIIITDSGHVENRLFQLPEGLTTSDIEKTVNILNEQLVGVHLHDIQRVLEKETAVLLKRHIGRYGELMSSFGVAISSPQEEKVFYGGKTKLLHYPEFSDLHKAQGLITMMDQANQISKLFSPNQVGIHIRIGSENTLLEMEDCSVITASYTVGEEQMGSIAIIGPTRMDYRRVVTLLDLMSGDLSRELTRILGGPRS